MVIYIWLYIWLYEKYEPWNKPKYKREKAIEGIELCDSIHCGCMSPFHWIHTCKYLYSISIMVNVANN